MYFFALGKILEMLCESFLTRMKAHSPIPSIIKNKNEFAQVNRKNLKFVTDKGSVFSPRDV